MNKNTMLYGLLVAGGLLAYYAWKKNKANTEKTITSPTSTSGTFVDDVSVLSETGGIKYSTGGLKSENELIKDVKNSVSQIVDPFISEKKQLDLSGELI